MAALVISLTSGALTFFEALQGPKVRALPIEDVFVFAAPAADPQQRMLSSVARPEIANTAAHYPDILLSQAIVVMSGEQERACFSARGEVRFHGQAPGAPTPVVADDAAEIIPLTEMALEVRDVSSRAALPAGDLFSVRQLFDQAATKADINPCRQYHRAVQERALTAAEFVESFRRHTVMLRYESRFESDPGYYVDCSFELNDVRANRLLTRGWINVPCAGAQPRPIASEQSVWRRIAAAFDRLF